MTSFVDPLDLPDVTLAMGSLVPAIQLVSQCVYNFFKIETHDSLNVQWSHRCIGIHFVAYDPSLFFTTVAKVFFTLCVPRVLL